MGPNGSGKSTLSHALMGRGDYEVDARLGHDRRRGAARRCRPGNARSAVCSSRCSTRSRCRACRSTTRRRRCARGADLSELHVAARGARRSACPPSCSTRGVNDEFSGGEKKRAETVQLAVLEPKFAVLDEIDSGLDVDALARRRPPGRAHDARERPRCARDHALRAPARRAAARSRARDPRRPHRAERRSRARRRARADRLRRPRGRARHRRGRGRDAGRRHGSVLRPDDRQHPFADPLA